MAQGYESCLLPDCVDTFIELLRYKLDTLSAVPHQSKEVDYKEAEQNPAYAATLIENGILTHKHLLCGLTECDIPTLLATAHERGILNLGSKSVKEHDILPDDDSVTEVQRFGNVAWMHRRVVSFAWLAKNFGMKRRMIEKQFLVLCDMGNLEAVQDFYHIYTRRDAGISLFDMYDEVAWNAMRYNDHPIAVALLRNNTEVYEWLGDVLPNVAGNVFDPRKHQDTHFVTRFLCQVDNLKAIQWITEHYNPPIEAFVPPNSDAKGYIVAYRENHRADLADFLSTHYKIENDSAGYHNDDVLSAKRALCTPPPESKRYPYDLIGPARMPPFAGSCW
jgi:hypothetical protein